MSLPHPDSPTLEQTEEEQAAIKALVDSFAKSNLHDAKHHPSKTAANPSEPRPMRLYTRQQLLYLYKSPLVRLPPNMPDLRQWFGDNELLLSKKESELVSNGRGRFKRETEDGDTSSRPSFRSTPSQPSQMGNFKHQSLRSGDRDRDRDGDRDRETRDKEGLRHLSDKYDRDRLGMLPAGARGKERDSTPLNANSSNRTSSQNQSSRRGEVRDSQKKRPGEPGDDWRRNDATRTNGDERDDPERARSKARDSSKSRRSPSTAMRERDDRPSRSDRDRDDHKRERDTDRDQDDDPRRWRDDGKRDERIASRRAERDRDMRSRGDHWEPSNDRRWTATEDRDGRYKRASGRDKRSGGNGDELRDRDERREREREKEKEPAWMETYVPTGSSGILGGKSSTGELDGIQVWKKGLKEKELALQEKNEEPGEVDASAKQDSGEKGLDEIQIFKLLMKREEEKKIDSKASSPVPDFVPEAQLATHRTENPPVHIRPGTHTQSNLPSDESPEASGIIAHPSKEALQKLQGSSTAADVLISETGLGRFSERPEYNPPAGSRLLALGRASAKSPVNASSGPSSASSEFALETMAKPGTPRNQGFSPFEERALLAEDHGSLAVSGQFDAVQRPIEKSYGLPAPSHTYDDSNGLAYANNKGSRFAKFFDNKSKESAPPGLKPQTPTGFLSSPLNPPQRQEQSIYGDGSSNQPTRTMEDIFEMLNNSSQAQRANILSHPTPHHPLTNGLLNQTNTIPNTPSHPQHFQSNGRLDALYDSRLDDRFVPDGMVPGLRPAPPPRNRDVYQDLPDEALHFHLQRLQQQQQQQRGPDLFNGPNPSMYGPQNGRNVGLLLPQAQFRGGPSPGVSPHSQLSGMPPQRLPPGLANLGGRPPHDPAQMLNIPGHLNNPLHANLPPTGLPSQQQPFNNFVANSNIHYNNSQLRGSIPNLQQLPTAGPHPSLGPIGLGNNLELRSSQNPNQALGVGGLGLSGPRGNGLFNHQQTSNHLQGPLVGTRQQQGHPHIPPHLIPHFQPGLNGPNGGHSNDLMALLMSGTQRE